MKKKYSDTMKAYSIYTHENVDIYGWPLRENGWNYIMKVNHEQCMQICGLHGNVWDKTSNFYHF